jgi:hypothetical protein
VVISYYTSVSIRPDTGTNKPIEKFYDKDREKKLRTAGPRFMYVETMTYYHKLVISTYQLQQVLLVYCSARLQTQRP